MFVKIIYVAFDAGFPLFLIPKVHHVSEKIFKCNCMPFDGGNFGGSVSFYFMFHILYHLLWKNMPIYEMQSE